MLDIKMVLNIRLHVKEVAPEEGFNEANVLKTASHIHARYPKVA
jgi:hypothetical protein